jgi:hypothetical protein
MARRTHVRRCVGVRGDGTAERRARSQIGEAGGSAPRLCAYVCVPNADGAAMAATQNGWRALGKGTEKRKTARNGPAALVGDIRRRTTSRVRECACTGSARKDKASTRCWCVRVKGRRHSRGDGTTPTTCAQQGFVLTRLQAKERKGLRSTVACSVCGCRQRAGTRRALVGTRSTRCQARSARVAVGSGTCKATGSARWPALKRRRVCAAARCGTAGDTPTASSQGSVQPRLEGRVHIKVKGFLTSRSGHGGEAARWSRGRRPGARLATGEAEQDDAVSSRSGSYPAVAT